MVMSASTLRSYIEPILSSPKTKHIATIRIGTKSLAWWPYRFLSDKDASDMLGLLSEVVNHGRQLAVQAHFSHPRELEQPATQEAARLIRLSGAQVRCQSPLIKHVNNRSGLWKDMWSLQVRLGLIPYYMFVERDTGARDYFSVPLVEAFRIFSQAHASLPGTARTVRGPSMSASPGKIVVLGDEVIRGERVLVLKFLQARNPDWTNRIFFAKYDQRATWFDELVPAFGEEEFFFSREYQSILSKAGQASSGQLG